MRYLQRKPGKPEPSTIAAAQYHAGGDLSELALVHANIAECTLATGTVLVARWIRVYDDHPDDTVYEVVEDGDWLCASTDDPHDGPWSDTTAGLSHWYDEVERPPTRQEREGKRPIVAADIHPHLPEVGWSETPEEMWNRVRGLPRVGDQAKPPPPDDGGFL